MEYFFGENFGVDEIQNLNSILRSRPEEYRKANIDYIQKVIKLQKLGNEINRKPKDEVSVDQMKDFLSLLIDVTKQNKVASNQVDEATKLVLTQIEFKGIDFNEYLENL